MFHEVFEEHGTLILLLFIHTHKHIVTYYCQLCPVKYVCV